MTDKKFVLSMYPNATFHRTKISDISNSMLIRWDGGGDWSIIQKCKTEKEGWAEARRVINERMMRKLES